jgi:hypothetical protein
VSSTTDDPDTSNNAASSHTDVSAAADLSITQSDDPDPVPAGGDVTYTLTVSNADPAPRRTSP